MDQYTIPRIFGKDIGIIIEGKNGIQFQYSESFNGNELPISPLLLPYDTKRVYTLHDAMAFNGLPGIFNDSLPDRFGSMLMNQYFIKKYGSLGRLSVVDKLLYINTQGMGAIEYHPLNDNIHTDGIELRKYINEIRGIIEGKSEDVISKLTQHPSSGGARPKAAIMWDKKNDIMSVGNHSIEVKPGNEAWIIKFDEEKREDTLVEYCYMTAAKKAGISVPPIEIIHMDDENHFAIKRFDREENGRKLHLATLSGILNLDFNQHASTSYETCMKTALTLTKDHRSIKEIFRRMVFNVIGKNCDDHSKNTSFIMNEQGEWKLSPAYDLVYNNGHATFGQHRMYIAGKIDNITVDDLAQCGYEMGLEAPFMKHTIEEISDLFSGMETNLLEQGVSKKAAYEIGHNICQFSVNNFPSSFRKDTKRGSRKREMDNLTKKILEKSISKKRGT
jgi:serine/threonine-protein kinase HipA